MIYLLILITMLFIHFYSDFHQGDTIANLKQKSFWLKHPDYKKSYKHDYVVVLLAHGFIESFLIEIPVIIYSMLYPTTYKTCDIDDQLRVAIFVIILNTFIHAWTDNKKANKFEINLIQDQLIHIAQVCFAWITFVQYYIL